MIGATLTHIKSKFVLLPRNYFTDLGIELGQFVQKNGIARY